MSCMLIDGVTLNLISFQAPPFIATPEVSLVSLEESNNVNATSATDVESVISLNFDWRACRQGKIWKKPGKKMADAEDTEEENEVLEDLK